jgi:predicted DNA-binding protein
MNLDKHRQDCACPACLKRQGKAKVQKAFRLKRETLQRLQEAAESTGKHQNEIIEEALKNYFEEGENNGARR